MKKWKISANRLRALYPPMSDTVEISLASTLSSLVDAKEKPKMKRKLSFGLVLAAVLLLATISAAIALSQSDLFIHLFGGQAIPKGLEGTLRQPEETVSAGDVSLTLNEYVFDGDKLHLRLTLENTSGRQVMFTMSPLLANGAWGNVSYEKPMESDDHTWAYVLGGEADGVAMPGSVGNCITFSNTPDADGNIPFRKGETVILTGNLYLWEILHPPVLVDRNAMAEYEAYEKVAGLGRIPVDKSGFCDLESFCITGRDDIGAFNAEESRKAYEYLGWARLEKTVPIALSIPLDTADLTTVEPAKTTFEGDGFTMVITGLTYRQTGGTLYLEVYPKPKGTKVSEESSLHRGLTVLDADSLAFLNGGTSYGISSDNGYACVSYTIDLNPVPGNMPSAILIAPMVVKPKWDWEAEHDSTYDRYYTYDLKDAVRVELK